MSNRIRKKVKRLLELGFYPYYNRSFPGAVSAFGNPLTQVNEWLMDGSFIWDMNPSLEKEVGYKQLFRLEASVEEDEIELHCLNEIWGDYSIVSDRYYYLMGERFCTKAFTKKIAAADMKEGTIRNIKFTDARPKGVLYLISGGGFTKIGISTDPLSRQKTIGTKTPFKCLAERHYVIDRRELKALEFNLHRFFVNKKSNGEWFTLSEDDYLFIDYHIFYGRKIPASFDYNNERFNHFKKMKNLSGFLCA